MATIKKRGNSYLIRVSDGYDVSGKQIVRSLTWKPPAGMTEKRAEKEAHHQAALFEERVRSGIITDGKVRFADFAEYWFSRYAEKHLKLRTVARYKELMVRIIPSIGHIAIDKIRPAHLLDFYNSLESTEPLNTTYLPTENLKSLIKRGGTTKVAFSKDHGISLTTLSTAFQGKPISKKSALKICNGLNLPLESLFCPSDPAHALSPTTVRHYHSLISSILGAAVSWQYIPYNPCSMIDPPKAANPDILFLDDEQSRQLLVQLKTVPEHIRRCIIVLLLTGMRRGELLGLERDDINFEANVLRIRRTSQYLPGMGVYTDTPKNETSTRFLMFSSQTAAVLREQLLWLDTQEKELGADWLKSNRIFTGKDGRPLRPDALSTAFKNFIRKTDLPDIHLHSLRHTNATLCIANHVPITAVAEQLGHANVSTTATIYAHSIKAAQIAAANTIGNLLDESL